MHVGLKVILIVSNEDKEICKLNRITSSFAINISHRGTLG